MTQSKIYYAAITEAMAAEMNPISHGSPVYSPKKHTKQTYRSQQRAAKKRKK